jgi:hypothetical protein
MVRIHPPQLGDWPPTRAWVRGYSVDEGCVCLQHVHAHGGISTGSLLTRVVNATVATI